MSIELERPPLNEKRKEWADWFYKVWVLINGGLIPLTQEVIAGDGLSGGGVISADVTLNVGEGSEMDVTADTINLNTTGVTPGAYTNANITVNQYGRITAASVGGTGSAIGTGRLFMVMGS